MLNSQDRVVVLSVVAILGAVAILTVLGTGLLIARDVSASKLAIFVALGGPAIGGIAAMLASTHLHPPEDH